MIRRKIGGFGIASLLMSILKSMIASIVMGGTAYFIWIKLNESLNRGSNLARIVQVGFPILFGIVIYLIVMWIIDRREMQEFMAVLRHRGTD
jgi:hypothetical protein